MFNNVFGQLHGGLDRIPKTAPDPAPLAGMDDNVAAGLDGLELNIVLKADDFGLS